MKLKHVRDQFFTSYSIQIHRHWNRWKRRILWHLLLAHRARNIRCRREVRRKTSAKWPYANDGKIIDFGAADLISLSLYVGLLLESLITFVLTGYLVLKSLFIFRVINCYGKNSLFIYVHKGKMSWTLLLNYFSNLGDESLKWGEITDKLHKVWNGNLFNLNQRKNIFYCRHKNHFVFLVLSAWEIAVFLMCF